MPKIPDEIKKETLKDIEPLRNNVYVEELEVGDTILIPFHEGTHLQVEETYTESSLHRIIVEHNVTTKVGANYEE